ncbi:hypothetical protein Goklo_016025 [Gossypium klotzschianum]|uniref:Uncharacterized protein n=1 Tax=Gossypium klotzschianum TaxID=34286 RepID=A0A7J8UCZ8_9ROSI|nr:hypothetical protein [Gossypium klotzschianum]
MDEEIIQGVIDVPTDDEQDPDDSSVLPHVSPKEAFLAVDIVRILQETLFHRVSLSPFVPCTELVFYIGMGWAIMKEEEVRSEIVATSQ